MQNLRRSLQNKTSSGGLSPNPNRGNPAALAPPRKVIKALYDYNSQQTEELSFTKGDFFHVVGNEDDEDWYEACNPVTGARGYVPVTYFQILEKNQRNSSQSLEEEQQQQQQQQQFYQQPQQSTPAQSSPAPAAQKPLPKCQPLYGIVLYDFGAERPDELDAKVGDAILVIAQSNEEWYVAKPIGRLGGPGLIPVSFVEIRDMATGKAINVPEMLRQTGTAIPRVEEWKKQAMDYKANSIPLGKIDSNEALQKQQQAIQQQQHQQQHQQQQHFSNIPPQAQQPIHPQQFLQQQQQHLQNSGPTIQQLKNKMSRDLKPHQSQPAMRRLPSQELEPNRRQTGREDTTSSFRSTGAGSSRNNNGDPHSSNGGSFHDQDLSNVIVEASVDSFHHEDDQYWFSVSVDLASGATRRLLRLYEDFYNFHIALLEEFPVESGRVGDQPRILPFMPIPLQMVDDAVTATRQVDLDGYVQDLCKLPTRIIQHPLVNQLFGLRDGDTETPAPPVMSVSPNMGSSSPSMGRLTPSNGMFNSSGSRQSPSVAARAVFSNGKSQQGPGSYRGYNDDSGSMSGSPSLRSASSFSTPTIGSTNADEFIKLKVSYQDDISAMRIPVSVTFQSLQQKIFERLDCDPKPLSYRDSRGDFAALQTDIEVREAIDHCGGKLVIYVD
ncbi:bud emergence protein 1 [Linnemannia elongata]|nr:bud emergence protein 1 [Linnemannia elongata]KAG0080125.1 bud emergence protein 1 [Linnemannia elongata]